MTNAESVRNYKRRNPEKIRALARASYRRRKHSAVRGNGNSDLPVFLYVLDDPREPGNIRYVGQTQSLQSRLGFHCCAGLRQDPTRPLYLWVQKLLNEGVRPRMRVWATVEFSHASQKEKVLIAGLSRCFDLLNQQNT